VKSYYYILGSGSTENRSKTEAHEGVIPFWGSDFYVRAATSDGEGLEAQQEIQLGGLRFSLAEKAAAAKVKTGGGRGGHSLWGLVVPAEL
jgi:hypothetical protein